MSRTLGKEDLTPRKKGLILAKANLREYTTRELGRQEGVSAMTVSNIIRADKNGILPPEVYHYAKMFEPHLKTIADANTIKASLHTFNTIHELSADKAAKVAETMFNIGRVLRDKSTTNSANNQILDFVLSLIKNFSFDKLEALEAVRLEYPEADLNEIERVIDGELLDCQPVEVPVEVEAEAETQEKGE